MVILRLVVMAILEILKELAKGANRPELVEKCVECAEEIEAAEDLEKKDG